MPKKNQNNHQPRGAESSDFTRPRKLLFEWLSVGVLASLLGNIAVVIVHALYAREEHWWCGVATTVSG